MRTAKLAAAGLGLAIAFASASAFAAETVNASLWENPDVPWQTGQRIGDPTLDRSMAAVGITLSTDTVQAGEVTFEVTNDSGAMIHEMVVVRIADLDTPLPYNDAEAAFDEEQTDVRGEVAELDPGASGSVTLTLEPGMYALICNVSGHYMAGMWTVLTVE